MEALSKKGENLTHIPGALVDKWGKPKMRSFNYIRSFYRVIMNFK